MPAFNFEIANFCPITSSRNHCQGLRRSHSRVSMVSWIGMKPTGKVSLISMSFMSTKTLPRWLWREREVKSRGCKTPNELQATLLVLEQMYYFAPVPLIKLQQTLAYCDPSRVVIPKFTWILTLPPPAIFSPQVSLAPLSGFLWDSVTSKTWWYSEGGRQQVAGVHGEILPRHILECATTLPKAAFCKLSPSLYHWGCPMHTTNQHFKYPMEPTPRWKDTALKHHDTHFVSPCCKFMCNE